MLNSAFLRRTLAAIGIGAVGMAPIASLACVTLFTASVTTNSASADVPWIIPPPHPGDPNPEDVHDGTGGVGNGENLPPHDGGDEDDVPPEDVHDGTGGVGGNIP